MILTYAVENFRGIGERQEIDFIATSKNEHSTNLYDIEDSNLRVNNGLCLIGPNGSGKSHVLQSLSTLSNITLDSTKMKDVGPFILNSIWNEKPTVFEILLYDAADNEFLAYELHILNKKVIKESLEVKQNKQSAKNKQTFTRIDNTVTLGNDVKVSAEMINATIDSGSTLLSYRNGINIPHLKVVGSLLAGVFYFTPDYVVNAGPSLIEHILYKTDDNKELDNDALLEKNEVLASTSKLLRNYGIRIRKIELAKSETNKVAIRFYPEVIGNDDLFYSFDEAGNFFSEGTFNTIVLVLVVALMSAYNHILLLDEVDGSIHHKLALEIIDYVRFKQNNMNSQFIISTHDIMLLDNKFRRDSIYTVIRGDNLESRLMRVSDFSVRKDSKLSCKYFANEFGALPNIMKASKFFEESPK